MSDEITESGFVASEINTFYKFLTGIDVLMDMGETAEYLKISKSMLYKLVENNQVPFSKIGAKVLFRKNDLYRWLGTKGNLSTFDFDQSEVAV